MCAEYHVYRVPCVCVCVSKLTTSLSQIMKEWAEADNQSKNLPKSDRQALNEVNARGSSPKHIQTIQRRFKESTVGPKR